MKYWRNNKGEISEEEKVNRSIRRKTLIAFSELFLGFGLAWTGWKWLLDQPKSNGVLNPLRKALDVNEKINATMFSDKHLVKEYPKSKAVAVARVNGDIGMDGEFDDQNWQLTVHKQQKKLSHPDLTLSMADIKKLPKREIVFDFKCIEGWDEISCWGGTTFYNFMLKYNLGTHSGNAPDKNHPEDLYKYVALETPDNAYYVGIDMKSIMQEQTLLCYEHNGKDLPYEHGYPLRLIIPVKYGVKNLKRIGNIYFTDNRPPDYWFENGYDYDAAL